MVAIDESVIRELAGFKTDGAPVTTCYLNVDGRRLPRQADCLRQLEQVVRQAEDKVERHPAVADDLERIEAFVRNGFDRSSTRGLAFFACSARGLWKVVELPVPVRDQLVVNTAPAVGQLEQVVQEHDRFGVLLVDRQRARMFVFEMGVFTASADGISTNRDVATDNTATAPTMDGLINAKYAMKQQYWGRAKWLFHQDVVKVISKIKDTTNNYIWRESVRVGEPDTLLGIPTYMSQYAPNTMTSGQYVGILGDFSFYWIADSLSMEMQRLVELYSKTRQIGLHAWLETDGMPVLEEAFVRVKLG